MNARICQIITDHNFTVAQYAREIGVDRLTVHRWINGKREPLILYLHRTHTLWPDVDLHWLITGEKR
jgi:transcriptional regulator with XRE-family HTH domain